MTRVVDLTQEGLKTWRSGSERLAANCDELRARVEGDAHPALIAICPLTAVSLGFITRFSAIRAHRL